MGSEDRIPGSIAVVLGIGMVASAIRVVVQQLGDGHVRWGGRGAAVILQPWQSWVLAGLLLSLGSALFVVGLRICRGERGE